MKRTIAALAGLAVLLTVSLASAQTRSMTPAQPSEGHSGGAHAPGQQSQPPMMGHGMMSMMCPMMGPGMMGMSDPQAQARMLKLRGDMMKAMGDVLLKHAQEIEQAK